MKFFSNAKEADSKVLSVKEVCVGFNSLLVTAPFYVLLWAYRFNDITTPNICKAIFLEYHCFRGK